MKNWETKKVAEEHIYKYEVQTEIYPVRWSESLPENALVKSMWIICLRYLGSEATNSDTSGKQGQKYFM